MGPPTVTPALTEVPNGKARQVYMYITSISYPRLYKLCFHSHNHCMKDMERQSANNNLRSALHSCVLLLMVLFSFPSAADFSPLLFPV